MPGISRYNTELDRWIVEVDEEAAQLVASGLPPYDALTEAVRLVKWRRVLERIERNKRIRPWHQKSKPSSI